MTVSHDHLRSKLVINDGIRTSNAHILHRSKAYKVVDLEIGTQLILSKKELLDI